MNRKLEQMAEAGQSVWLDSIRRNMFTSGELRRLIELGLRGLTSNPTLFERALAAGREYDEQIAALAPVHRDPGRLFEVLAVQDIRSACDAFRPLYERLDGGDGLVSLEVSPLLARDTQGSIAAAKRLWDEVGRANAMIKIPGTPEGIPAIRECIASGISINVTLLFSVEQYEAAANAYLQGLEHRVARRLPVDHIASVASLFISRIDSLIDARLQDRLAQGEESVRELLGKAGIATAKLTYERFRSLFSSERFAALQQAGARVQRPLWGSTSTKNPLYPDLLYVESLIGRRLVNTMPPTTLAALLDHGRVVPDTIESDLELAHAVLDSLGKAQISLAAIGRELQADGIKAFADSYGSLLAALADKIRRLTGSQSRTEEQGVT
jgi:transaldolase/glucose-6-phosphate isomerase